LKVYNKKTKRDIGSIVDISLNGMRLISEEEFSEDSPYHFVIKLPKGYIHGYSFDIDADMRWCRKAEEEQFYEAGFKFINADKSCVTFLQMLISDFKSNNLL
jgi:hypothetical protein